MLDILFWISRLVEYVGSRMNIYVLVLSEDCIIFYTSFFFFRAVALSLTGSDDAGRSRGGTSGERAEGCGAMRWCRSGEGDKRISVLVNV